MLSHTRSALTFLLLCCCPAGVAFAQDADKPLALLRQTPGTGDYFIKVQTNAKLQQGAKLSAILSNKDKLLSWEEEVKDCASAARGKFCKEGGGDTPIDIIHLLPGRPAPGDRLKVSFAISEGAVGSFRSVDVVPDFKGAGPRIDADCAGGLVVDLQSDNPAVEASEVEKVYYESRLRELGRWLETHKGAPSKIATVLVEPMTKEKDSKYTVNAFSVVPAIDPLKRPQDLDVARALDFQKASVCLQFNEPLPNEKFNAKVTFQESPPVELERALVKALTGRNPMASPSGSKIPDDTKLGLRSLDNNLEFGILFTSSVKDVKKDGGATARERQSRGAFDVRFAPLLRWRTRPPEEKKWQPFWTPVFVDAKVSTGKIAEDTLSLNRILIGTEISFRNLRGTREGERDKYVITLRGVNASDRDFKRVEAKAAFEFRPIFEGINQPLKFQRKPVTSSLIPDGPLKEVPDGGFFGYQIQPFVSTEFGRVYRRDRSAFKGEEGSDTVRRLLFGTDMAFNLGPRFTLKLADTFYVRGETPSDRGRNYFNGELEAGLGKLSGSYGQSIFFSFERGGQPPFATPDVNAFKFGFRLRSDFFDRGPAR